MTDSVVSADDTQNEEKKKKKKGGCLWRIVFWLALLVFIASAGILGYLAWTYWLGQHEYDEIAARAFPNEQTNTLADMVVDWDALRAINPEVVAWVYVPDTIINYPVAHKPGDSQFYLKHNFSNDYGKKYGAEYGCIMLSGENAGDFSDEVNIIYGHHLRNGAMFAPFGDFYENEMFNQHRTIYLLTPQGNYRLETFAVEHVPMTHGSIATPNYATDQEFTEFKEWLVSQSVVTPDPDTSADALAATKLFGFCTCDGEDNTWRYITFAVPAEFVPIEYVGTGEYHGNSDVSGEDVGAVEDTTQDRIDDPR